MKVSCIIPTLVKNQAYLDLTIQSLIKHTQAFDIELLITENGDFTGYPQGQCQAVNRMAERATGEWIMVSNDDMYYAPGWDMAIDFTKTLCFSPNLAESVNIGSAKPFLKLATSNLLEGFESSYVEEAIEMLRAIPQGFENGFNLPFFIRRDVFDTIGGYDAMYDPWGSNSDSDLQTKIELAGIQSMRNRDVLVYHFGSKSGTFEGPQQEYWQKNWDYYIYKWGFPRSEDPWYSADLINYDKLAYKPLWRGQYAN